MNASKGKILKQMTIKESPLTPCHGALQPKTQEFPFETHPSEPNNSTLVP